MTRFYVFLLLNRNKTWNRHQAIQAVPIWFKLYSSCTSIGVVTFVFNNFLNTARGVESVRFLQTFWSIPLHQMSLMVRFSSSKVVGFNVETFCLINLHKRSMGLRSGEFSGHLSTLAWCGVVFLAKAEVVFTSCHKDKQWMPHGICISVLDGHPPSFMNIYACTTFQKDSAPCYKAKSVMNWF